MNSRMHQDSIAAYALSIVGLFLGLPAQTVGEDTNPAPFPDQAAAVLVQGSTEAMFLGDVNSMESVLSNSAYKWNYAAAGAAWLRKLTTGATGDFKTSWTNVGRAIDNVGKTLWGGSVADQNFLYYHSSHGGPINNTNKKSSELQYHTDGDKTVDDFWHLIRDEMPDGGEIHSLNGATQTACVRTMTYILQACYSGGHIHDLTEELADKTFRRKYFPFLSDITVMTAADYNERSWGNSAGTGSTFSQAFYGFTDTSKIPPEDVTGALQTNTAKSVWAVYKDAADNDVSNPDQPYTIGAAWGSGDNATMYERGDRCDGSGDYEHPLYRHVRFYPAHTLGDVGGAGNVDVAFGDNDLDLSLTGDDAPVAGPLPLHLDLYGVTGAGHLETDRDIKVAHPDPSITFVDYYTFDLNLESGLDFDWGELLLEWDEDDIPAGCEDDLVLYQWTDTRGWVDLRADFYPEDNYLSADIAELSQLALAIPEPAALLVLALGAFVEISRRRPARCTA